MKKFAKRILIPVVVSSITFFAFEERRPTLFVIGDSTVKNGKDKGDGGLWGWGHFLGDRFDTTKIAIRNDALGGRSSRTFITEGHWDEVLALLQPGDFVIMQFGHNDGGALDDTARARGSIKGTGEETKDIYNPIMKKPETVHSFGWYMRKYVGDCKAKGVTAIICSPIPRNNWIDGKCERGEQSYGKWAEETATTTGAFFVDLNNIIADRYDQLGQEKVKEFFPGDHTHTNEAGAILNANAVVTGLKKLPNDPLKAFLLPAATSPPPAASTQSVNTSPQQSDVLQSMRLANGYFMDKWPDPGKDIMTNVPRPSNIWTRAIYYEGLMALYSIDPQPKYYDYAADWGTKHQWNLRYGPTGRNADDQCCGQTYIDLYKLEQRPERIAAIKTCMDNMLPGDKCEDWNWIDAIQMAMPVFTGLGVLYKDTSYFKRMYDFYHYTKAVHGGHGLYNPADHLWWRDKDFAPPYKEPNGQDCYWSRGNGWVLAALVRVLSILPQKDPHRSEYLQDYLDMIRALVAVQRPDGFWNVSLHDPTHFGGKELTGTALFTYGIAWGIRQGYLDKQQFLPAITRAWEAMTTDALHANGFLGYVQGTGKEPKGGQPVTYDEVPDFEDFGLGCFLLAGSEVYQLSPPTAANLDEAKVPASREPDLLRTSDGRLLTSTKDWETLQRPHFYRLFEENVYGRMPERTTKAIWQITSIDSTALAGTAICKELVISFPTPVSDTAASLHVMIWIPRNIGKPVPVFVGYNFGGNATVGGSSQWPLATIIGRGFGVATAWYGDIEPDRPDGWQTGIRTRLSAALQIEPNEWSAIGAWAWGLDRLADYLVSDRSVDPKKLIVIGHSRLGKTALWAGAGDPRFAIVVSNESGEGGAALSKRDYGETIGIINYKFPYWFSPMYKRYGHNTEMLPLDQHMLLSLIAPRPLYVASAEGDQWSDPQGEFLSARLADAVYGLYREKGIGTDSMPGLSHPTGDFIRYHIRPGKHDITLYDWQQYMDFADWHFKTGSHR
jgi:unsaturated rhamnogalacturonyl hydrolase